MRRHLQSPATLTFFLLAVFQVGFLSAQVWTGVFSNDWNDPANWTSGGVPNSGQVFVDGDNTSQDSVAIIFPGDAGQVDGLVVDAGDAAGTDSGTLFVSNLGTLSILENNGAIGIGRSEGQPGILAIAGDVLHRGQGRIEISEPISPNFPLTGIQGTGHLMNEAIIQGAGVIGDNTVMSFTNESSGRVSATGLLVFKPSLSNYTNRGILEALAVRLRLDFGTYDNSQGIIQALGNSSVALADGAVIIGGLFQSESTARIEVLSFNTSTLVDITNIDAIRVNQSARLELQGNIENLGELQLINSVTFSELLIDGPVTLSGGGTVSLIGNPPNENNRLQDPMGDDGVLTNLDNQIRGRGRVGNNSLQVINQPAGQIIADNTLGTLILDPRPSDPMVNRGILAAQAGGTLALQAGQFNNSGGVIRAEDGSTVRFEDLAEISGGVIRSLNTGVVEVLPNDDPVFNDLIIEGTLQARPASRPEFAGIIDNRGTIVIDGNTTFADFVVDAQTELVGQGTIRLTGNLSSENNRMRDLSGDDGILTNVNNVICGRGRIGMDTLQVINQDAGEIVADVAGGTLILDPRATDPMVNQGLLRSNKGGELLLDAGDYDNTDGIIRAETESTVSLASGAVVLGGTIESNGTGVISIGNFQTATVANVSLAGNLDVSGGGRLNIVDSLNNSGQITLLPEGAFTQMIIDNSVEVTGNGSIALEGLQSSIVGTGELKLTGGTLAGIGAVRVPLELNDVRLEPGNSIGTLQVDDPAEISGPTVLQIEAAAFTGIAGTDWDLIEFADSLDIAGNLPNGSISIELVSLDQSLNMGPLANFDPDAAQSITIVEADAVNGFSLADFQVDTDLFQNPFGGTFYLSVDLGSPNRLLLNYTPTLLGDVNQDGVVNLLDVMPFVDALSSATFIDEADMNQDGLVNLLDVQPFVAALSG